MSADIKTAILVLCLLVALAAIDAQRPPSHQWGTALVLAVIDAWQAVTDRHEDIGRCLYTPTCSVYGELAIRRYGAYRGGWLALARIDRCNPKSTREGEDWLP
ncbi:MAG: membrane protein insertion efficiency factor YidD [Myxococcales bacterium]|nr:membrane protein insertion efficiency factor YidD [Myxococcales bacterium]